MPGMRDLWKCSSVLQLGEKGDTQSELRKRHALAALRKRGLALCTFHGRADARDLHQYREGGGRAVTPA